MTAFTVGFSFTNSAPIACLVRIPGTINSKCGQGVKLIQKWDGLRSAIRYLLRDSEFGSSIKDSNNPDPPIEHVPQTTNSTTIRWVEKLLQIPIDDHRKFVVWRILAPYLINIRKSSSEWAYDTIQNWLDICRNLKQLDFSPNYTVRYNIKSAKRNGYLPISLEKLKIENWYLYHVLVNSQVGNKL